MIIDVNAEGTEVAAATLDALVAELGHEPDAVATALNGEFVPRAERAAAFLKGGDRVEILSPMQGG